MVEVKGAKGLVAACVYPVNEGMEVFTNTQKVRKARKMTLELILSNHQHGVPVLLYEAATASCRRWPQDFGVDEDRFQRLATRSPSIDDSAIHLVRDNSKCVLCRRCVAACPNTRAWASSAPMSADLHTHIGCRL